MYWFWIGFFVFVAICLAIDLGIGSRQSTELSFKSALKKTIVWVSLGMAFTGVVYLIYDNHWLGANPKMSGGDAAVTYVSAYLLEEALSVDNIFVISLIFRSFKIPGKYQHRVLFWGIIGAVVFRVAMLGGGVWLTKQFTWIFYFFGAYLIYSGLGLLKGEDDEEDGAENSFAVRTLRRFVRVVDGDHGGKFMVRDSHGRRALTILAVTVVVVELTDIVFALDSIPAVLAVSQESFVIITSNIMAILGLRSLYFMLAGAMAQFDYLKYALAGLLVFIGAKMIAHDHLHVPNLVSLAIIAGFIGTGVVASIIANRRRAPAAGGDDAGAGGTPA
ncbi:MAG: TerC/Alx family metal homeostasis membrane protein [Myxococcales bacterium]|nr:TerC/Alx family metal homeostasis membrane protein [Myxococcales bacterium]MBK7196623.1 TerC/Alx family metal homeostasis membrane protein [Myxococcales bacterium]MBP6847268.1 TerC/Alx family metal homeostasis membrane protein [Kofleriaceae bacterium]